MLILILITLIFVPIYVIAQKSMYIEFERSRMLGFVDDLAEFDCENQAAEIDEYVEENNSGDYIIRILNENMDIIYTTRRHPNSGHFLDNDYFIKSDFTADAVPVHQIRDGSKAETEDIVLKKTYTKQHDTYYVYCRESLKAIDSFLSYSNRNLLLILVLFTIICSIGMLIIISVAVKPIKNLSRVTESIAKKDYSVRYNGRITRDEIGALSETVNEMADTIQDNITSLKNYNFLLKEDINSLSEYENMRKRVVANITHELKTPLAIISSQIEIMNSISDPEKKKFYYSSAMDEIDKMSKLISRLLNYSAKEKDIFESEVKSVNLSLTVNRLCQSRKSYINSKKIRLITDIDDDCVLILSREHVEHVFNNYLTNAIRHTAKNGRIKITLKRQADSVRLSVYNDGAFISDKDSESIWYEFSSLEKDANGGNIGLGLFIVKEISVIDRTKCGFTNCDRGVEFWFDFVNA